MPVFSKQTVATAITDASTGLTDIDLSTSGVSSDYTPAVTDKVFATPFWAHDTNPGDGNISCWVKWDTNVWKVYVSDSSYIAADNKILIIIKTN
tara:strand:- start:603 stop:884 length:282 start_codon:yes stop_codon:yes gene_type:complete